MIEIVTDRVPEPLVSSVQKLDHGALNTSNIPSRVRRRRFMREYSASS
jgi:hypothetical protein